MSSSAIVTIILARVCDCEGTCEPDNDDWEIVDTHVRVGHTVERGIIVASQEARLPGTSPWAMPRRYVLTDAEMVREHLQSSWPTCPLRYAFGEEIPPEVVTAERVLVRGRVHGEWSHGMNCGSDYDETFEMVDYRILKASR